jgi:hypothetical protein
MKSLGKLIIGAMFVITPALALPFLVAGTTGLWNAVLVRAAISNGIYVSGIGSDGMAASGHYLIAKKKGGGHAGSSNRQPQGTSGIKLGDTRGGSPGSASGLKLGDTRGGSPGGDSLKLPDTD